MITAAVDIGNTAIKYALWKDGSCNYVCGSPEKSLGALVDYLKVGHCRVAYCTTRELDAEERRLTEDAGWWELKAECRLPIKVEYATPGTLGADRLAAALGAWKRNPGKTVLVADAGTALTLDLLTADGVYRGGNISAGLAMRLRALHEFTSRLPLTEYKDSPDIFGHDTVSALRRGAGWGVAWEIAGAFRMARKEYGCGRIALTGGNAPELLGKIERALGEDAVIDYVEALVEEGIKVAYDYNHDKRN